MSEEILINVAPMETRVALIDNGVLQEVYLERNQHRGIVGNIYRGKVARVLPGMQAAFIDIGLDKAAFLHASDISSERRTSDKEELSISSLVKEGDGIFVQVIKDPLGTKGARLTTNLSVSSRYLVYMPNTPHVGVSQRIEDQGECERLRQLVERFIQEEKLGNTCGFIVRTVAEGVTSEDLLKDIKFLVRLWSHLNLKLKESLSTGVIHEDIPLYLRAMRDLARPSVERVLIDSDKEYRRLVGFCEEYEPSSKKIIERYQGERPIFDLYNLEDELDRALAKQVQLKSGGHIIIEQTEAMTTVDVNTGAFVGNRNLEETIYKTNLEAAVAIARHLRLRNLGGIIILDFIDMKDPEHRRQVLRTLEKGLERDRAKTRVLGFSELGLVQMTRQRTRESLERIISEPCVVCHGKGTIKSAETVCYEIFREILREAQTYDAAELMVLASQTVIDRLLDEDSSAVADIEKLSGKTIRFQVESTYAQDHYDVILV